MSERAFFEEAAHQRARKTVEEIESHTSAEVVISVRRKSGSYRDADYLFGLIVGVATLVALLYLPQTFALWTFPLDVAVGFVVGAVVCAHLDPLRRLLVPASRRRDNVRCAARAAFWEQGISRTSGRTGVLVFVSVFERRVEVIPDIGVDTRAVGDEWRATVGQLQAAVAHTDFDGFVEALAKTGPLLGQVLERSEDDVNELADGVDAA